MNNELDRLETLIDEALATYTPPVVRPGLEQRILAAVSRPPQRQWSWKPIWALAAAATLMDVIAIPMGFKSARPGGAVVARQSSLVSNILPSPLRLLQNSCSRLAPLIHSLPPRNLWREKP
jgi:hypothetical protein